METILFRDSFEYQSSNFEKISLASGILVIPSVVRKIPRMIRIAGGVLAGFSIYRMISAVPKSPFKFWLTLPSNSSYQILHDEVIKSTQKPPEGRNIYHLHSMITNATHLYYIRTLPTPIDVFGKQVILQGNMIVSSAPIIPHTLGLGYLLVHKGNQNMSGNEVIGNAGNTWTSLATLPNQLSGHALYLSNNVGGLPTDYQLVAYYIHYSAGSVSPVTDEIEVYVDNVEVVLV